MHIDMVRDCSENFIAKWYERKLHNRSLLHLRKHPVMEFLFRSLVIQYWSTVKEMEFLHHCLRSCKQFAPIFI